MFKYYISLFKVSQGKSYGNIYKCVFKNNYADCKGSAISMDLNSSARLCQCHFENNSCEDEKSQAIYCWKLSQLKEFENNKFIGDEMKQIYCQYDHMPSNLFSYLLLWIQH